MNDLNERIERYNREFKSGATEETYTRWEARMQRAGWPEEQRGKRVEFKTKLEAVGNVEAVQSSHKVPAKKESAKRRTKYNKRHKPVAATSHDYRFVTFPLELLQDDRVSAMSIRVAGVVMRWFWSPEMGELSRGWATNSVIARQIGKINARTVSRCLNELEQTGWIKFEQNGSRARRTIVLLWREKGFIYPYDVISRHERINKPGIEEEED